MDPTHPEIDDTVNPTSAAPGSADRGRWSAAASSNAQAWLTQLQAIMDEVATQSAPVAREIGAKAAELAALAAERAGPLAQRAAEATQHVSVRVAERSRGIAADLRGPAAHGAAASSPSTQGEPIRDAGVAEDSPDTTAPVGPTV